MLKNKLATLRDPVVDRTLVQIVLNGLPRSYKFMILNMTYAPVFPTFDIVCSKLITKYHKIQHRNKLLGDDDEALAVSFRNNLKLGNTGGRGRFTRGKMGLSNNGRWISPLHGGPTQGRRIDFRGRGEPFKGEVLPTKSEELLFKRLVGFVEKLDTLPKNVGTCTMVCHHLQWIW